MQKKRCGTNQGTKSAYAIKCEVIYEQIDQNDNFKEAVTWWRSNERIT